MSDGEQDIGDSVKSIKSELGFLWIGAITLAVAFFVYMIWPYGNITTTGTINGKTGIFTTLSSRDISQSNYIVAEPAADTVVLANDSVTTTFADVKVNSGITYSATNNTFVVPIDGLYSISATIVYETGVNNKMRTVVMNDTTAVTYLSDISDGTHPEFSVSGIISAAAGDEIKIVTSNPTGADVNVTGGRVVIQCINAL